jgi:hypothetical protein
MVVKPLGSHTRGRCRCEIPPSPSPARPLLLEREIEIVDEARWGLSERDNGAGFLGMKEQLGGLPSPASNIAVAAGRMPWFNVASRDRGERGRCRTGGAESQEKEGR